MNWGPLLTPIWVSNFVRVLHMVVRSLWSLSIDNLIKVRVENWILKCSAWGSLFETLVNADVRLTDAVFQRGADLKAIVLSLMSIYFQLALRPRGRICSLIEIVPVFEDWWLSHWVAFKVLCAFVEVIIHSLAFQRGKNKSKHISVESVVLYCVWHRTSTFGKERKGWSSN